MKKIILGFAAAMTAMFGFAAGGTAYVSQNGGNVSPYASPADAATDIHAALALKPDKVIVGNGTYNLANEEIDWACEIVSENGPDSATINGNAIRAFTLKNSAAILNGFKLTGGQTGSSASSTTGNIIQGNAGLIKNCVISYTGDIWKRPFAYFNGSIVISNCVFRNCKLSSNSNQTSSHEIYLGDTAQMTHCVVSNFTFSGSMSYNGCRGFVTVHGSAVLRNSLFVDNRFNMLLSNDANGIVFAEGNGTVENCTFVDNRAPLLNGAVLAVKTSGTPVLRNLIFDGNTIYDSSTISDIRDNQNLSAPWTRVSYSCSSQLTGGTGNLTVSPKLGIAGNPYMPAPQSACIDSGFTAEWMTGATDIAGGSRIIGAAPDMGCYEAPVRGADVLGVSISALPKQGVVPFEPSLSAIVVGDATGITYSWNFGDGTTSTEAAPVHTYQNGGVYALSLTVRNGAGIEASDQISVVAVPETVYVSTSGQGVLPYGDWNNAATTFHDAFLLHPKRIVIDDGTHYITTDNDIVDWPCEIISRNGPDSTTLQGSDKRVMYLNHAGARLSGFRIHGGAKTTSSDNSSAITVKSENGFIDNCVFTSDGNGTYKTPYMRLSGSTVISNCVIRTGKLKGNLNYDYSHTMYIFGDALMTHCVVSNCTFNESKTYQGCRGFVTVDGNATIRNSLFAKNTHNSKFGNTVNGIVTVQGNATVESCTFADNAASLEKGGILAINSTGTPILRNLIFSNNTLYDSTAISDIRDHQNQAAPWTRVTYSCSTQLTQGTGNLSVLPKLGVEGYPYMPADDSACLDHGLWVADWMAGATDLIGNDRKRGDAPDMGCYEAEPPDQSLISVSLVISATQGQMPFAPSFSAIVTGNSTGLTYSWDFGDGQSSTSDTMTHAYNAPGVYTVTLTVQNSAGGSATDTATLYAVPDTVYVSSGGNGTAPYASWSNAATNFHDAYQMRPKRIVIDDGTYYITTESDVVDWGCEIVSRNGAGATTLHGSSMRVMYLNHENARLSGFRITGGAYNNSREDSLNAITVKAENGLIDNCYFASSGNNTYKTPYTNISGSTIVSNCIFNAGVISGNLNYDTSHSIYLYGDALMTHCIVTNCSLSIGKSSYGGCKGIVDLRGNAILRNSLFVDNQFAANLTDTGKGIVRLAGNAQIDNCTFVRCETPKTSGGIVALNSTTASARNLVFEDNIILDDANVREIFDANSFDAPWTRVTYSCSSELTSGEGNITSAPALGTKRNPFCPRYGSPCINAGTNLVWMTDATDLFGNPRRHGRVDMGCCESVANGLRLLVK